MADERRNTMDDKKHKRYVRIWHFLAVQAGGWIRRKFHFSYDMSAYEKIEGPVILIPNHACNWDPILIGIACKNKQSYFVMSEHMARVPAAGKLIRFFFNPILRRKASTDLEMVRECFRHTDAGHSICLFAEGDQTWDGITGKVYPATGQLVKLSKAALVTVRLEGAFLSHPRWASGLRRGRIEGRIAGVYTPEEIQKMSVDEVQRVIERDLYFDIWEWQRSMPGEPVAFRGRGKNRDSAKGIDMLFFMCPGCGSIGTIRTEGSGMLCECGFRAKWLNTGFIEPVSPAVNHPPYDFTTIPGWDGWQREELEKMTERILADGSEKKLFEDGPAILSRVEGDHKGIVIGRGKLALDFRGGKAAMTVGESSFDLNEIKNMALILSRRIVFSYGEGYYEISTKGINIRKYLLVWNTVTHSGRENGVF